jgi:ClpP class serine protease
MNRISAGLKDSSSQFTTMIDKIYAEMIQVKMKTQMEMIKITKQFSKYRDDNNLDEYFLKTLSDDTRKNTLKLVDALMIEEDWMEQMREYKHYLDKLQYSETD